MATGDLIILAEDDPQLRRIYFDILDAAGYNVLTANDGVQALQLLSKATPRLLILDIMMPNLNGIETCKRARLIIGGDIPIIFLSALDSSDILRDCVMAGGDDYMIKSDSLSTLLKRIRLWMTSAQRQGLAARRAKLVTNLTAKLGPAAPATTSPPPDHAPVSWETSAEFALILSLVKEALEQAGPSFGKTAQDKNRLAGYVNGVVDFWAGFNEHVGSLYREFFRAVLEATGIVDPKHAGLLIEAKVELSEDQVFLQAKVSEKTLQKFLTRGELSEDQVFLQAKACGRNDAAQRKQQGDGYSLVGLSAGHAANRAAAM